MQAELQEKTRTGESFHCNEKFGPNHICKNKQLNVMILEDFEEDRNQGENQNLQEICGHNCLCTTSRDYHIEIPQVTKGLSGGSID